MGGVFKNEFSWSWSRRSTFESCLRKYYYQHYGFWGGWNTSASPETRELYIQKKLLTRAQWMGIVVHEAAEWTLKSVTRGSFPLQNRSWRGLDPGAATYTRFTARALPAKS